MTRTCKDLGCDREATLVVEVNAPVRGHGFDYYCREHGDQRREKTYVRDVVPLHEYEAKNGGAGA